MVCGVKGTCVLCYVCCKLRWEKPSSCFDPETEFCACSQGSGSLHLVHEFSFLGGILACGPKVIKLQCLTSQLSVESCASSCFPSVYGAVFVVCSLLDQEGGGLCYRSYTVYRTRTGRG